MSARRRISLALVAAALLAGFFLTSPAAASEPLRMSNMRVEGGEANWHAENVFRLEWDQVPGPPVQPKALHYRLFDEAGNLIAGPLEKTEIAEWADVEVPPVPGVYIVEAWLEGADGQPGTLAWARLRFDDTPPPAPVPQAPTGWLGTRQPALLKIGHPQPPLPPAGIRGYAISLDGGSGGSPCASRSRCTLAETDLSGGIGDDTIDLGSLPEGITYARVVAVSGSGVPSPVASTLVRVDTTLPQVSLQGLPPSGWSSEPVRVTAVAVDPLSGMASAGASGPFTAVAVDGALPQIAGGDRASASVTGNGLHRIRYFARDAAGNVADGELGGPSPASATVGIDEVPPQVAFAPRQDRDEPERIEATVSDALSGPSSDCGSIELRPLGRVGRFRALPTHVTGDRLVAFWDSDTYPQGRYEFLARGCDHAGNSASGEHRSSGPKMILANPLKAPVKLAAGFGEGRTPRASARAVSFGRSVTFGGRLTSAAGAQLGGLEVAVTESFPAGSHPRQRTTLLRTGPDGTFSLRLAPGTSREVTAAFAGTRTLTRATAPSLHLDVRAGVRFRASAATARVGGRPILFSGRVARAGTAPSQAGLPVELQFRYPGADWSEFRTVEADARGRFHLRYRFSDDDSRGVRFQFRAYVGKKEGWPYEPAFSPPVVVTGR